MSSLLHPAAGRLWIAEWAASALYRMSVDYGSSIPCETLLNISIFWERRLISVISTKSLRVFQWYEHHEPKPFSRSGKPPRPQWYSSWQMVVRVEDDTKAETASCLNEDWLWSIQSDIFCGWYCVGDHVRFSKDVDFHILAVGGYTKPVVAVHDSYWGKSRLAQSSARLLTKSIENIRFSKP